LLYTKLKERKRMVSIEGLVSSSIAESRKVWRTITTTITDEGTPDEIRALDVASPDLATIAGAITDVMAISQSRSNSVVKVIDNATFNATITSADIDFSEYTNFNVTYKTGTVTTTPTMTLSFKFKGADGLYHADPDYPDVVVSTATEGIAWKGMMEAYNILQIVCTFGGTGNFAGSSVALRMKS
jgi:hypothetical protein